MFRLLHEPAVAVAIAAVFAIALMLRRGAATRALRVFAPIRVDLLIALPVLAIVSIIGIAALVPRKH